MSYSLNNLKKLRSLTEVSIGECIKALNINDDDLLKALQWLKERSLSSSKSSKFESSKNLNKFGLVKIVNFENKIVTFVLKCESDFVAMNSVFTELANNISTLLIEKFAVFVNYSQEQINEELKVLINKASYSLNENIYLEKVNFFLKEDNEKFGYYIHYNSKVGAFVTINNGDQKIAKELSMQVVANSPLFLTAENIPDEIISSKLKEIKNSVDSENSTRELAINQKIISGKFNKWISEVCFLEQNDFRNPSKKIKEILHGGASLKNFFLVNING